MKFIDCARFMATSLSNLADNLTEGIHKLNVKIVIVFLNMKVSRTIRYSLNVYVATKFVQTKLMKN